MSTTWEAAYPARHAAMTRALRALMDVVGATLRADDDVAVEPEVAAASIVHLEAAGEDPPKAWWTLGAGRRAIWPAYLAGASNDARRNGDGSRTRFELERHGVRFQIIDNAPMVDFKVASWPAREASTGPVWHAQADHGYVARNGERVEMLGGAAAAQDLAGHIATLTWAAWANGGRRVRIEVTMTSQPLPSTYVWEDGGELHHGPPGFAALARATVSSFMPRIAGDDRAFMASRGYDGPPSSQTLRQARALRFDRDVARLRAQLAGFAGEACADRLIATGLGPSAHPTPTA